MGMFFHHIDHLNQEWERRVLEEKCLVEQLQACNLEVNFFICSKYEHLVPLRYCGLPINRCETDLFEIVFFSP